MSQAKSYSFNSVGIKKTSFDKNTSLNVISPPIGIKTPVELGEEADGIFKMHRDLGDQIKDNLINLILTNTRMEVVI